MSRCPNSKASDLAEKFVSPVLDICARARAESLPTHSPASHHSPNLSQLPAAMPSTPRSRPHLAKVPGSDKQPFPQPLENSGIPNPSNLKSKLPRKRLSFFWSLNKVSTDPRSGERHHPISSSDKQPFPQQLEHSGIPSPNNCKNNFPLRRLSFSRSLSKLSTDPRSGERHHPISSSDKLPFPQSLQNSGIPSPSNCKNNFPLRRLSFLRSLNKVSTSPRSGEMNPPISSGLLKVGTSPMHRRQSLRRRRSSIVLNITTKSEPVDAGHRKDPEILNVDPEILNVKSDGKTEHSNHVSPTFKQRLCADNRRQSFVFSPKSLDAQSNLMKKILEIKVKTTSLCV